MTKVVAETTSRFVPLSTKELELS